MADATAEVTSMPDVDEPVSAASILLRSTDAFVDVDVAVDDKSELTEEVVLIASTCSYKDAIAYTPASESGAFAREPAINSRMKRVKMVRRWRLATPPPLVR
jgi:hypothetical protein